MPKRLNAIVAESPNHLRIHNLYMNLKKGVKLLEEYIGSGVKVERQHDYVLSIRISLNEGEVITRPDHCLSHVMSDENKVFENGYFEYCTRFNREHLIAGVFYALEGMHVGGYRKVKISPHLAYGEKGVPGLIPSHAVIIAELNVIKACTR